MNNKAYQIETRILQHRIDNEKVYPIITPLYQNSAFSADSLYFYTRKNNPNCEELEQVVADMEGAEYAISTTTGMTAISLILSLLRPKDHVVLNALVYGCSYKLFHRIADQRDLSLTILDLTKPDQIETIPSDVKMVFFETPTNPFLKSVNISSVAQKTKSINRDSLVVVDNTWATPLHQAPLQHGADVSVYSLTKYFSGHSDVMGGMITTNRQDLSEFLRPQRFYTGGILDPHSAWLLRRSMYTFMLRMREHERMIGIMSDFLNGLPQVSKVYLPEIDGNQLTGYGCILFFQLRDDLVDQYHSFAKALRLFDTGTGMACVTSTVAQPYTGSHASMSPEEKEEMGLGKNLVRLCFGMESLKDLQDDILQALNKIDPKTL